MVVGKIICFLNFSSTYGAYVVSASQRTELYVWYAYVDGGGGRCLGRARHTLV